MFDLLDEYDRCRVFNTYVVPALKDALNQLTDTKTSILFTYDFSTDIFEFKGIYDFDGLKEEYNKVDYLDLFTSATKQLKITKKNANKKINICVFQYAPRGSFNPSLYKFGKNILNNDISLKPSVIPTTSSYNRWFSNDMLKSRINWEVLNIKLFDDVGDHLVLIIFNDIKEDMTSGYCTLDSYVKACEDAIVPTDMIDLIKEEHGKGNLLIINVVNYLKDYFLLVHYKIDGDKVNYTFVSSPNDDSL